MLRLLSPPFCLPRFASFVSIVAVYAISPLMMGYLPTISFCLVVFYFSLFFVFFILAHVSFCSIFSIFCRLIFFLSTRYKTLHRVTTLPFQNLRKMLTCPFFTFFFLSFSLLLLCRRDEGYGVSFSFSAIALFIVTFKFLDPTCLRISSANKIESSISLII